MRTPALLLTAAFLSAAHLASSTTSDSTRTYTLHEVVIRADRMDVRRCSGADLYEAAQLTRRDLTDAHQTLSLAPGFFTTRNFRNEGIVQLRGFEQRQVSLFLDGVPISLPFDGSLDISQLAGDQLTAVHISKGLTSPLYSANTLGGAINLLTRTPDGSTGVQARLEASDHTRRFASLGHQGSIGRLWYAVDGSWHKADRFALPDHTTSLRNEADGNRDNSAFEKKSGTLKCYYPFNDAHLLGLNLSVFDNLYQVPPNAESVRPRYWRFPEWKKNLINLSSSHHFGDALSLRSTWFYDSYHNILESYDDATYSSQTMKYAFTSIYDDYSYGAMLYPTWSALPWGKSFAMLGYKHDVHREKNGQESPYTTCAMETWSLGLEQDLRLQPRLESVLGFGINHLRSDDPAAGAAHDPMTQMNGEFGLLYHISSILQGHAAVAFKSRFPTLKELFSERLASSVANPDLKPEYARNFEAALIGHMAGFRLGATFFHSQLRDLITRMELGKNTYQMQNISSARLQGLEASLRRESTEWSIDINYTYLQARDRSAMRNSDHLAYRPAHRFNASTHWQAGRPLQVALELSYSGERFGQNTDTGAWQSFAGYTLVNARLAYQTNAHVQIYGRANNIGDVYYVSEYGIPMPGREFVCGLRLTW